MHYIALKALPHGQQPGELFEESEAVGNVFIAVAAARKATDEEIAGAKPKRGYRRRDMRAQSDKS